VRPEHAGGPSLRAGHLRQPALHRAGGAGETRFVVRPGSRRGPRPLLTRVQGTTTRVRSTSGPAPSCSWP
jgi:hypothetical protein